MAGAAGPANLLEEMALDLPPALRGGPILPIVSAAASGQRVIAYGVDGRDGGSRFIVKSVVGGEAGRHLERESELLNRIDKFRGEGTTVLRTPRIYGLRRKVDVTLLAQESLRGMNVHEHFLLAEGRIRPADDGIFAACVDAMHQILTLETPKPIAPEWRRAWLAGLASLLDCAKTSGPVRERIINETVSLLDHVETAAFQHGDFFSKNLLIENPRPVQLAVIDWADAGHHLPPFFDLYLFVVGFFPAAAGANYAEDRWRALEGALAGREGHAAFLNAAEEKAASAWGVDPRPARTLWMLLTISHQMSRLASDSRERDVCVAQARHLVALHQTSPPR